MGTRYIIEVIHNSKVAVRQYGQWDGGQERAGAEICKVLARVGRERMNEFLSRVNLIPLPEDRPATGPRWLTRDAGWEVLERIEATQGDTTLYDWGDETHVGAVAYLYLLDADMETYRVFRPGRAEEGNALTYFGHEFHEVAAVIPEGLF